ncbi:hypothetical protein RND71_011609 [Anisodus tanguticus]|uniref:Uncharacterized protein n=1 Tax=Anisodus tanguticus TaxID=243964 RepID=A0AAE1SE26_9SOLA|nr:hypothetical protein RND71_011609 [Anisodus tanguticus]
MSVIGDKGRGPYTCSIESNNEIAFNEAITEEREQRIQEIQQQIGEVNEIFKDLDVLFHNIDYNLWGNFYGS